MQCKPPVSRSQCRKGRENIKKKKKNSFLAFFSSLSSFEFPSSLESQKMSRYGQWRDASMGGKEFFGKAGENACMERERKGNCSKHDDILSGTCVCRTQPPSRTYMRMPKNVMDVMLLWSTVFFISLYSSLACSYSVILLFMGEIAFVPYGTNPP